ncbi:MAG: FAD-dependent oxidoreductase, partial [Sphaerochaetaceae bacterium]|nr:FAD-dependent oxidoreductase [Sphaerochaetaceae bacterium]
KMSTKVLSINGDTKVTSVKFYDLDKNESYEEDFDGVFIFVGTVPKSDLVPMCNKTPQGYIITDNTMMTNIEGLFAVGDVRDTPFRQVVTAASDGAIAAHYANEYIEKNFG